MLQPLETNATILIIDDQESNLRLLERVLISAGYHSFVSSTDPLKAVDLYRQYRPDLVVLDLHMPMLDGIGVLERLNEHMPEGTYVPVLVITGDLSPTTKQRALSAGAKDFLGKPFDPLEVVLRIKNLLEARSLYVELQRQNEVLEEKVAQRRYELEDAQLEILERLGRTAEFRDDDTMQHTQRVGVISARMRPDGQPPPPRATADRGRERGREHHAPDDVRVLVPRDDGLQHPQADHAIAVHLAARRRQHPLHPAARRHPDWRDHVVAAPPAGAPASPARQIFGHPAEIVADVDPYTLGVGASLPVRCLVGGRPLAGWTIVAGGTIGTSTAAIPIQQHTTDPDGRATVRLTHDGHWFIRFVHMREAAPEEGVDYVSRWATLTFGVLPPGNR